MNNRQAAEWNGRVNKKKGGDMIERTKATGDPAKDILEEFERQRCEVWTRVMGYHRPVSEFNPGKKSEHYERMHFVEPAAVGCGC